MKGDNLLLRILIRLSISFAITLGSGAVVLLLATFAAYCSEDPMTYVKPAAFITLVLTATAGGIISSRICPKNTIHPALFSAISGFVWVLLMFLMTVIPLESGGTMSDIPSSAIYAGILGIYSLVGFISRPREKKRLPYKKKYKR